MTAWQKFCPGLTRDGRNFRQYTKSSALAWPKMDRTFGYTLKVLPLLAPRWAELLAMCKKFCPGLAQDGQNFMLYTRISAVAGPKIGKTFSYISKVLPWSGPRLAELLQNTASFATRWAKLSAMYQKFRPGLAQNGQKFLQYTKSSALAWPKIGRTPGTRPKDLPWPGPRRAKLFPLY